jgi:N-acyl-D-aspartate/D-glutamate deacylase
MADLVVRNGTIVDGTGAPAFVGDVAIVDGRVVAVGSDVDAAVPAGTEEIDATGLLVTPGWVDIHTHYDGQATWDDVLAPTAWHGVTTLVMGNCGVGFAPATPIPGLVDQAHGGRDIPSTA